MADSTTGAADQDTKELGRTWVVIAGAAGLVALAGAYVLLRANYPATSLADHANLGNALAPVVAFLTLLAVVAALASVQIQRTELALQRQELRETREEMVEQRRQFERTAKAQEDLAASQAKLAAEQEAGNEVARNHAELQKRANHLTRNANRRAAALELAQRAGTLASLFSARVAIAGLVGEPSRHAAPAKEDLDQLFDSELRAFEQLKTQIAAGEAE